MGQVQTTRPAQHAQATRGVGVARCRRRKTGVIPTRSEGPKPHPRRICLVELTTGTRLVPYVVPVHVSARQRLSATPTAVFADFSVRAGGHEAARAKFQLLVADLVGTKYGSVREVSGPGGYDWGIDAYVGDFNGTITVWQSKFFPSWEAKRPGGAEPSQRKQVRASFNEVMAKANEKGFTVDQWTLCVACDLPPEEQLWFDNWKASSQRKHKVRIDIETASGMRRWLLKPDSDEVADRYFRGATITGLEPIRELSDPISLSTALFVRQLEEAGHAETDSARALFFAAEALVRSLRERGEAEQLEGLKELQYEVHALWEQHFNAAQPGADEVGRLEGLIERVLALAAATPDPLELRLRPAHRRGLVHRLVDEARAGWVVHWREIAASHDTQGLDLDSVFEQAATT